ncbi:MAG: hypothetical protein EOM20_17755, partial [Spartobacteria bacterium]|nr:hypothetical protein [Spartobacteria bacterium]
MSKYIMSIPIATALFAGGIAITGCQLPQDIPPPEEAISTPLLTQEESEACMVDVDQPLPAPIPISVDEHNYTDLMFTFMQGKPLPRPSYTLAQPGHPGPVNYSKYGTFRGLNTADYAYTITNLNGLQEAVGEAVYPNKDAIYDNPVYKELANAEGIDTSHWNTLKLEDTRPAVFLWADAPESVGTKAYFMAAALERAGHIMQAIKAYHAVLIHFPGDACWSPDGSFVWYLAPAALGNIHHLCQTYPELSISLKDAHIQIDNRNDTDLDNDIVTVNPGHFIHETVEERIAAWPALDED